MTALDDAVSAAIGGEGPETIALMRVLMEAEVESEARVAFAATRSRLSRPDQAAVVARLDRLVALWDATPGAWAAVRGTVSAIAHRQQGRAADDVLAYWADRFDRLVAAQPEASVALYSLGSPRLLAAATEEIVVRLREWGLISAPAQVLDLGCGIGRFLQALAPHVTSVVGLDLSTGMVEEAARRCREFANVSVRRCSGRDLEGVADGSLDLILAADVFPYLVEAGEGLVSAHLDEAARVLRPGGALLILNFSYRGRPAEDRADVAALCGASGLVLERAGTHDFTLWDGAAFLLRRAAAG